MLYNSLFRKSLIKVSSLVKNKNIFSIYCYSTTKTMTENNPNTKHLISVCHMRTTNDKESNLKQVKEIIQLSKAKKSEFVFLPECCDYVGENRIETLALSEKLDGQLMTTYKNLAKEFNIWLSIGGFHESVLNDEGKAIKIFNSHVIINNQGQIVAVYHKLHMFDVDTPEFKFRESEVVTHGSKIVPPVDTPIGPLGLQICYDMRFPEVSTILRYQGAKLLTYPSAFAYSTGLAHWEILLRSRAIENQCYVIAPAQTGFHNPKRQSFGRGMIVDPWGKIIAECDKSDLNVAVAEIDLNLVTDIRKRMPCLEHRRKDIYSLIPIESDRNLQEIKQQNFMFSEFQIPNDTVFYCSESSFAFTNIRCVVPGHVLIASKRVMHRLKDLHPEEITDFFQTVCKVQKMLETHFKTDSSTVTVQDGQHAGQTVKHLHCHIMPRKEGDFPHNDLVYAELNKHDSANNIEPRRSTEEMIEEASLYRNLLFK